jgi:hypothetical protein
MNNIDVAPTLLTLMGLDVPEYMKGRIATEPFRGMLRARRSVAAV